MSVIRVGKRDRFTAIDRRTIRDDRLSFRARGVLVWLLDKPDDWQCRADVIASEGIEGREAVLTALRELVDLGYLVRRKWQDAETGKWHHESVLHEQPLSVSGESTTIGLPDSGFPDAGNPTSLELPEKEELEEPPTPAQRGPRSSGTNPRAQGTNPRGPREQTEAERRDEDMARRQRAEAILRAENEAKRAELDDFEKPALDPDFFDKIRTGS